MKRSLNAKSKLWARTALVSWSALAVATGACGGGGGSANDAGTGGDAGALCTKQVVMKTAGMSKVIADFATSADMMKVSWGYSSPTDFSGYSYTYPPALVSAMSADGWHVTGTVADYAGMALGFSCAVDASMFTGISFSVKGNVGETGELVMAVATSPNDVKKDKDAAAWGQCVPVNSEYDGTCLAPRVDVPVTTTLNTIKVKWADLKGGAPQASVSPNSLSSIVWTFDWVAGANPYPVDVTIDDVVFTVD